MADFDGTWKQLFHNFTDTALSTLCGIDTDGCKITELPTEYGKQVRADLVYEVVSPDGEPTTVHIEVQASPEPMFERRMVLYWVMLYEAHSRPPRQIVILPRGGRWCTGLYRAAGLSLAYELVDVTALDPETLLRTDLAPLALTVSRDPARLIEQVVARIAAPTHDHDKRIALVGLAILTAGKALLEPLMDAMRRHNMSDLLEDIPEVRAMVEQGQAQGEARGEARGEVKGLAKAIRVMLVDRFGEHADLDAIAAHLATGDPADAIHRVRDAAMLDELRP